MDGFPPSFGMTRTRAAALLLRGRRSDRWDIPSDSPLASLLRGRGYIANPGTIQLLSGHLRVAVTCISGLEIIWHHPEPDLIVVNSIRRKGERSGVPVLRGFLRFYNLCGHPEAGIKGVIHGIDSAKKIEGFCLERADVFAGNLIAQLEKIDQGRFVWYVGDPRVRSLR